MKKYMKILTIICIVGICMCGCSKNKPEEATHIEGGFKRYGAILNSGQDLTEDSGRKLTFVTSSRTTHTT